MLKHTVHCAELSRWYTVNLLLPVSQAAKDREWVYYYYYKAMCEFLCVLQSQNTPVLFHYCHSVEWGKHKLAQTSIVST